MLFEAIILYLKIQKKSNMQTNIILHKIYYSVFYLRKCRPYIFKMWIPIHCDWL